MTQITLKGNPINTNGDLPTIGSDAPAFMLVTMDLSEATLDNYAGKTKVLNIFPSLDTPVCALSVKRFNQEAASLNNTVVLNISQDLPFAHKRFCGAEGIENATNLSAFRSHFAKEYNLKIVDGPLKSLCARAIIIVDANNKVIYTEQVGEITQEPDYDKALAALK